MTVNDQPYEPGPEGGARPWEQPGRVRGDVEPHRGNWLRLLGTVNLWVSMAAAILVFPVIFSLPLAVALWWVARADLARMEAGQMDPRGYAETLDGLWCARVAAFLPLLGWLLYVLTIGGLFLLTAKR